MSSLDAVRSEWIKLQPVYQDLGSHVAGVISGGVKKLGIPCIVEHRPKGVANLLKKCLKKSYGLDQIGDKAGVRVVVPYSGLVSQVDQFIVDAFTILDREDKSQLLKPHELGYLGIHFQVQLKEPPEERFEGLQAEVQLHTRAQNLWSDTSHDLSYKPPTELPAHIQRRITRLVALSEIFDSELEGVREAILGMKGYEEARMLDYLERNYYQFSADEFDRELSLLILAGLKGSIGFGDVEAYGVELDTFVETNRAQIAQLWTEYAEDSRAHPVMRQPEAILIFKELTSDRFRLRDAWPLEIDLLEQMANAWGTTVNQDS